IFRREELRHRSVGPGEEALRWLELGPPLIVHREQARYALDHHLAGIIKRIGDERDPLGRRSRPVLAQYFRSHPFSPAPRLAGTAPAENEPGAPALVRGSFARLVGPCPARPVGEEI